ncbi:hypothetical protein LBMAG53_17770 [Planctomycetota bacterium]|nr:hypothetical protein LBMAG53_17770 [Planctomycetota bacterium]
MSEAPEIVGGLMVTLSGAITIPETGEMVGGVIVAGTLSSSVIFTVHLWALFVVSTMALVALPRVNVPTVSLSGDSYTSLLTQVRTILAEVALTGMVTEPEAVVMPRVLEPTDRVHVQGTVIARGVGSFWVISTGTAIVPAFSATTDVVEEPPSGNAMPGNSRSLMVNVCVVFAGSMVKPSAATSFTVKVVTSVDSQNGLALGKAIETPVAPAAKVIRPVAGSNGWNDVAW